MRAVIDLVARIRSIMDGIGLESCLSQALYNEPGQPLDILNDKNPNFRLRDRSSRLR